MAAATPLALQMPGATSTPHLIQRMRSLSSAPSLLSFVRFLLPTATLASSLPAAHFMSKSSLVSAADALPGRSSAIASGETHFVLKNPLHAPLQATQEEALFGCGCFWGAEKGFWRLPGVFSTAVGYAGGHTKNPTYEEVCSGRTAHTEIVRVVWDRRTVSFSDLLKLFWECHNPTQGMAQGNDQGTQYRSAIYVNSPAMLNIAEASKRRYQELLAASGKSAPITTEIKLNETFYFAEEYHQQYLAKPGARPYCSAQPSGILLDNFDGSSFLLGPEIWRHYDWSIKHCVLRGDNSPIVPAKSDL